jgi:hypothetical protein
MIVVTIFQCSICDESATRICVSCTKDTCQNHLCEKCGCCSDCCSCEVRLDAPPPVLREHQVQDLAPESEPGTL